MIAIAYFNELQAIPGFEVLPVGVAKRGWEASGIDPICGEDFQQLARALGVDAVVVGAVTEYSPYYPPRLGIAVRWYAANPCFHPIPPGYGLPWGTAAEEFIPESLVSEAEFALAQAQLATQTPQWRPGQSAGGTGPEDVHPDPREPEALPLPGVRISHEEPRDTPSPASPPAGQPSLSDASLPADWPDPRGFIPPLPGARPAGIPQSEPVLSLTRLYHGNDSAFTERLASYYYFRDEARFGGWQAYLQRTEDFVRFCCHLHIAEMLAARGGAGKTRVVWRWSIGRYDP
jgi:hypothetical protein